MAGTGHTVFGQEVQKMGKALSGNIMQIIELLVDGSRFDSARKQILDKVNDFQRELLALVKRKYEVSLKADERIVVVGEDEDRSEV